MLPDETVPDALLASINAQYPCRVPQLQRLSALIGDEDDPSPPSIIVHGLEATGKSLVVRAFLEAAGCRFAWVPCNECVTARHLTQRIAAAVAAGGGGGGGGEVAGRCDGVGALAVLDRIDQQRELTPTLLAGLGRLGEMIPNLTVIFIVTVSKARLLSSAEVPHIHFTPYTKDESIKVLSKYVRRITKLPTTTATTTASGEAAAATETEDEEEEEDEYTPETAAEELYVWEKFCGTVWDSLAKGAARDIVQFRDAVESMWDQFVQPIAHGQYGTRNFSQLYLLQKEMFRRESSIVTSVVAYGLMGAVILDMHDLPYYSKHLLCAAYLASYNPSRQDVAFFTKTGDFKKKRRGGGGGGGKGRPAKTRKIHRRLLGPQAWPLERMLAIFYAILPHPINSSVDLQTQIATLTSLRLLTKASVTDALEASTKWRVNVGWDYIRGVARSVKFDIEDFVAE
ncbi:origin recognition complex subunit 5 C-terminus-domain-containing protein, partial [Morchella snyderi]